jgi:hypothetical protein
MSPCLPTVLAAAHYVGRGGVEQTLHRLRRDFFLPGTRAIIHGHICAYATCQQNKVEQLHPNGLLQPLEVPSVVWTDIAMDFIEGFPLINGKSVILTVVDRFSKFTHFMPLDIRTWQPRWLGPSSPTLSAYMACRAPSSATEIRSSPASSGKSCSPSPASSSTSLRHFIPIPTASRKQRTR